MARVFVVIGHNGRPMRADYSDERALDIASEERRDRPEQAHIVAVWDVPIGRSVGDAVRIERGA